MGSVDTFRVLEWRVSPLYEGIGSLDIVAGNASFGLPPCAN